VFDIPPYAFWGLLCPVIAGGIWYFARISREMWGRRKKATPLPLSKVEREILHHAAESGPVQGYVWILGTPNLGFWVRAGKCDFRNPQDRALEAKYLDAVKSLITRGCLEAIGERIFRLKSARYEKAKKDT